MEINVSASVLVGSSIICIFAEITRSLRQVYHELFRHQGANRHQFTPEMTKKRNEELNPFEEPKMTTRVVMNQSNLTETTQYHLD